MSRKKHREIPFALLRRLLLAVLVLFVVTVVGLYYFGRAGRPTVEPVAERGGDTTENLVLAGEGFEYEVMREGRRLFHIRSDRIISQQEDDYELESVEIELTREDDSTYNISSDRGAYNLETDLAQLTGSVLFKGPNHVELRTEGLELRRKGDFVVSQTPVTFRFLRRFEGRAKEMRINSRKDQFHLIGEVRIQSLPGDWPPVTLDAKRFSYERRDLLVRAEGNPTVFTRGEDRIEGRRLTLTLTEEEDSVRFVNAYWNASGVWRQAPSADIRSTVQFAANHLAVEFDGETQDPLKAELESNLTADPAWLLLSDDTGFERRIAGDYLLGEFANGEIRMAQVFERVEILERLSVPGAAPLRRICSDTAEALFRPGGDIEEILLDGDVDIHDLDVQAHGARVLARGETGLVELFGDRSAGEEEAEATGELAWALHERGRLEAPRIVYGRDTGTLEAGEGVRAEIRGSDSIALSGNPEEAEEPIQVEARFADWSGAPSTVVFREHVRAWQGANYLLANELQVDTDSSILTATGNVKTVWISGAEASGFGLGPSGGSETRPKEDEGEADEDGVEEPPGPPEPMEVTAAAMEYDGHTRILTFSGSARAVQGPRRIQCVDIQLFRSEEGEFERMNCEGPLRIEDLVEQNVVTGTEAIYYPGTRKVRVYGSPVILRDGRGMELRGQTLVYDFETSTANLQSAEDLEAESTGDD